MNVQPYLDLNGRCEDAMKFYETALGAQIQQVVRVEDSPEVTGVPPEFGKKILHACVLIGSSPIFMTDGYAKGTPQFSGISLNLVVDTLEEFDRVFQAMSIDGTVDLQPTQTFFAERFAMVHDQFGVAWMFIKNQPC